LDFRVTEHPKAWVVQDDIFQYLVVRHDGGTVDVYRSTIGGVYERHKSFFDYAHFDQKMPETANAIRVDTMIRSKNDT
jgi:hypothetical protein